MKKKNNKTQLNPIQENYLHLKKKKTNNPQWRFYNIRSDNSNNTKKARNETTLGTSPAIILKLNTDAHTHILAIEI